MIFAFLVRYMNSIFFGSTSDSVIVLSHLVENNYAPVAVVTKPPSPIGRKQIVTPTPVETWAKKHKIPVLSFSTDTDRPWLYQNETAVINALSTFKPDLLISACYGQKIPKETIEYARFGGLNIHPSLLPRWRGADPIPWTILSHDRQTGVTIVTLSEQFDQGRIVAQKKILLTDIELSPDQLRTTLFTDGAALLLTTLPDYLSEKNKGVDQKPNDEPVARKLTRADGFIPWEHLKEALEGKEIEQEKREGVASRIPLPMSQVILSMLRAFSPWPGVWTMLPSQNRKGQAENETRRLKILEAHIEKDRLVLDVVQREGKNPVRWEQCKVSYLPS